MKTIKKLATGLGIGIALSIPTAGLAQIEEIVVTAQKRSESLQDVPIAVSAHTAETLKALGITDASELIEITPGLRTGSQSGSNRNYFLRGVGTADFHLTAAAAVGQYYDDITLTSGFQARAALFDIDRVEILKGPQNTLFGLNTTGGAINYISVKPEVGAGTNGKFSVKLGSESLLNTEGAVGFNLGEKAAGRVAFITNKYDGSFTSLVDGRDYSNDDMQAYRAAFVWEPSDKSSLLLNLNGSQSENNSAALRALGTRAADGMTACADFNAGVQDFEEETTCFSRNTGAQGAPAVNPSTGSWDKVNNGFGSEEISTLGFYLKYKHDFNWATLNLVGSWDNLDVMSAGDRDGVQTLLLHINQQDDRDTAQYEAQLISNSANAFRWIVGLYQLDQSAESYTGLRSPGIGGGNRIANAQIDHTKENLGVYFQGEYDIINNLTLTAGLRYSDETIVVDYLPSSPTVPAEGLGFTTPAFIEDINALVLAQLDPTDPTQVDPDDDNFRDARGFQIARQVQQNLSNKDTGYTVKLDWKLTDDSLLYASTSKGFKGGAADIRAAFALVPVANIAIGLERSRLDPESLEAYEVGYKASFLDNHLLFETSAFFYVYENLQQFITAQGVPTLENVPESEIKGLDVNLKYANASGFRADLGLNFLDTEVTDGAGSQFEKGVQLGNSPEFSLSLLAAQDFTFSNGSVLTLTGNVNHTGDNVKATLGAGSNLLTDVRTQPAYTLLNANLTYNFGNDNRYAVSIFGNNLTDEHFCGGIGVNNGNTILNDVDTTARPGSLSLNLIATCGVTRASTRTYGASFAVNF